ncbi:MAG: HAMP domain-containing protein [Euryarchaeota archaeon]|nr:HAMP domain-containing protein [Euryarchaeota archaeon]
MGLMIKLTVYFLIFSIVPLTVIGFMAYDSGRRAIEAQTSNYLTATTVLKEGEIEAWIDKKEREILLLARSPVVQKNSFRLAARMKGDPIYMRAYEDMLTQFKTLGEEDPDFSEVFFLNTGVEVIVSTNKENEGRGELFNFTREFYASPLEKPPLTITALVRSEEEKLLGAVSGKVSLKGMGAIVEEKTTLGRTGEIYLVDKNYFFFSERRFREELPLKKEVRTMGVEECLKQRSGVALYENYKGVPVIGSYRWMPGRELCIVAEIEQAEAFAPIYALRRAVVLIGSGITLVVLLFVVFLSHSITLPIQKLVRGAEEIGRGNLSHRIDLKTGDELAMLASSFNAMVDNLDEAQKKLVQSEKLASLGQMAAGIAHEMNNPLANISLNAQMLLRGAKEGDPGIHRLKVIEENVDATARIVRDLLDFSRETKLRVAPVDVNAAILKALGSVEQQLAGIEVVKNFGDLSEISADFAQLRQVFTNIITNACQAMPGGGRLTVTTRATKDNVEIKFTDTGAGIPKENLGKIFDPFFTTREVGKGTGLGLSISYGIIQKHRGKIEVESEVGKGSTFTIKLPFSALRHQAFHNSRYE